MKGRNASDLFLCIFFISELKGICLIAMTTFQTEESCEHLVDLNFLWSPYVPLNEGGVLFFFLTFQFLVAPGFLGLCLYYYGLCLCRSICVLSFSVKSQVDDFNLILIGRL